MHHETKKVKITCFVVFLLAMAASIFPDVASCIEDYYQNVYNTKHNFSIDPKDTCIICHTIDTVVLGTETTPSTLQSAPVTNFSPQLWDSSNQQNGYTIEESPNEFGTSMDCLNCHEDLRKQNGHKVSFDYPTLPNGNTASKSPLVRYKRYWAIPDKTKDGILLPSGDTSSHLTVPVDANPEDPNVAARLVRTTYGKMECDSCHDPHINTYPPFLRADPKKLCLVCHDR